MSSNQELTIAESELRAEQLEQGCGWKVFARSGAAPRDLCISPFDKSTP